MFEQLSMFDALPTPGTWVETHGRELTFDEIVQRVGGFIVWDYSTVSHEWFKIVQVEKIVEYEGIRRIVFYDGHPQRGSCSEHFFRPLPAGCNRARAYEVA